MSKLIVGVMGPGDSATSRDKNIAFELGHLIAQNGWILLTGGRNTGVMQEASRGAKESGGTTIGILPDSEGHHKSPFVDFPIITGMGNARNNINVLSSDIVIICGMSPGTLSEAALALKNGKHTVLINQNETTRAFFGQFGANYLHFVSTPEEAIAAIRKFARE